MSDIFSLDQAGVRESDARSAANPITPDELKDLPADTWQGIPAAIGEAVPRALVKVARGAELAGGAAVGLAEPFLGKRTGELTDQYFGAIDPHIQNAVDYWTPSPAQVGTIGQVLGGLTEGLTELGLGAGNPTLMLSTSGLNTAMDAAGRVANPDVAAGAGALEAATNALGFKIPFLGKSLLTRMASGAAGNLALGRAATLAQQQLLEHTGNEEAAKGYNPFDMTGAALDTLMGVAFGVQAHLAGPVTPLERDAALAALNAKHFQQDTAPGTPATPADSSAHQAQIEASIQAILRGDPVTPSAEIMGAGFIPTPQADRLPPLTSTATVAQRRAVALERMAQMDHIVQVLQGARQRGQLGDDLERLDAERALTVAHENPPPREDFTPDIPRADELSPEHRAIETRFAQQIGQAPADAELAYAKLPDAKGGKVLNTDTARELSHDYLTDRTRSAAVHEPASWLIKRMYARMLKEPPKDGEQNLVLFTAGGTGAGKSTAIKNALGPVADQAQIVYDTNLNNAESAIKKIDLALAAGKNVRIAYVVRDPVEALTHGALTRAMNQERDYGSGRTVPIAEHVGTHEGSASAITEVAAHYANDPRVEITGVDNTRGKGQAVAVDLADLPKIDYNNAREKAAAALEAEYAAKRISASVYRGFAGKEAGSGVGPGTSGEPQPERPQEHADRLKTVGPEATPVAKSLEQQFSGKSDAFWGVTIDEEAGTSEFDSGYSGTTCTGFACAVLKKLGAARVKVMGFLADDNPSSQIAADAGGHDFALVDGRYIVDGWLGEGFSTPMGNGELPARTVFDLKNPNDHALVAELYGDQAKWKDITPGVKKGANEYANRIEAAQAPDTKTIYTPAGRAVPVRSRVVEAASLITSDHPDFPQELQPRQRGSRKALDAQVATIAQKLEPGLLADSATTDTGAPIIGPGNTVESGNGRVMALRDVYAGRYANSPEKAAAYRAHLESLGHDTSGLKEPVLVRERADTMTPEERRAFTTESNKSTAAELSPVELAQTDARLLDADTLGKLRGEDLTTDKNGEFRRSFLNKIPVGERNAMLDAQGNLSQAGEKRLRAAILAKAYGGTPESNVTLGRILEGTSDDMRGALGALQDAAPMFARLRQMIADGKLSEDYDIAPAVLQAFEEAAALKRSGTSLTEHLATGDMFSRKSLVIKKFYDEHSGRLATREKTAAALEQFARQAMKERVDQSSLFSEGPLSADQILKAAPPPQATTDMFGLRTPQGKAAEAPPPDPDVTAAQQMAERFPKLRVATGEFTPEGTPVLANAAELMAKSESDIMDAAHHAQAFEAAINCAMQVGE